MEQCRQARKIYVASVLFDAAVVELVDTPDSKSCELMLVPVQVRPAVPNVTDVPDCRTLLAYLMQQ